jgi:hypothetical protein
MPLLNVDSLIISSQLLIFCFVVCVAQYSLTVPVASSYWQGQSYVELLWCTCTMVSRKIQAEGLKFILNYIEYCMCFFDVHHPWLDPAFAPGYWLSQVFSIFFLIGREIVSLFWQLNNLQLTILPLALPIQWIHVNCWSVIARPMKWLSEPTGGHYNISA